MERNRRRRRGTVRAHIDGTTYEYEPARLLYGVGSGAIRREGGANAERVAAALLLTGMQDGPLGPMFAGMSVDQLIDSAANLVRVGAITEAGLVALPPEFN